MRPYEPDVAHSVRVINRDDQTVLVAFDVKNDSIVANDARIGVGALDICRRAPVGPLNIVVPGSQRLLGVVMPLPKLPERAASNDPHRQSV